LNLTYTQISLKDSGAYARLALDHMSNANGLREWWDLEPSRSGILEAARRKSNFGLGKRKTLVHCLSSQYADAGLEMNQLKKNQLDRLKDGNTYTITTGHQLNLATGPLYFIYKIAHVIALCRDLNASQKEKHFVPIYWMATEDHDLDEIDHFHLRDKTIKWSTNQSGAVGRMTIDQVDWIDDLATNLGPGKHSTHWIGEIRKAYEIGVSLSVATQRLVHSIFGETELLVLDADRKELKEQSIHIFKKEVEESVVEAAVEEFTSIEKDYFKQVNARKINLFHLNEKGRFRLEKTVEGMEALGLKQFEKKELLSEIESHLERFSPNVLLRPIYQECILPNAAYIGGGAEVAYWLELSKAFERFNISKPSLWLRRSVQILTAKDVRRKNKLNLVDGDLLSNAPDVFDLKVRAQSNLDQDLSQIYSGLSEMFEEVRALAEKTDKSFIGAVNAQEAKQLKGYTHLKKRLLKAEKRKNNELLERLENFYDQMNAGAKLQERKLNVSEIIVEWGMDWIDDLIDHFEAFEHQFTILKED